MKLTNEKRADILATLESYAKLTEDRRAHTPEALWIALRYSCSAAAAEKMIAEARATRKI